MGVRANELRIGNWVMNDANYFEFDVDCFNQINSIQPIPLTQEWLLKFGFEGKSKYFLELKIENWEIHYASKDKKLTIEADGAYDENGQFDITDKIRYVHQLQNLYYALTGDELTIK